MIKLVRMWLITDDAVVDSVDDDDDDDGHLRVYMTISPWLDAYYCCAMRHRRLSDKQLWPLFH